LAHSKSALKRWRQSLARRDRNRSVKSQTRTLLNKAIVAIESDASTAEDAVRNAVSALDRAAQKKVIHENAAARGKSRLLKRFNLATANAVAAGAAAPPAEEPEEKKPARRGRAAASDEKPATRTRRAPRKS
jgi:small subunit ribosomal protein S20